MAGVGLQNIILTNARNSPPDLALSVQGADAGRCEGDVVNVKEMNALQDISCNANM